MQGLRMRDQLRLLVALSTDTFLRLHICFLRGKTRAFESCRHSHRGGLENASSTRVSFGLARQTPGATEVSTSSFDDAINKG
jgi:hypothetical protein